MTLTLHKNDMIGMASDAELERVASYTSGRMSDDDAEGFEKELENDAELFGRVAPWMNLWLPREPLPIISDALLELEANITQYTARTAPRQKFGVRVLHADEGFDAMRRKVSGVVTARFAIPLGSALAAGIAFVAVLSSRTPVMTPLTAKANAPTPLIAKSSPKPAVPAPPKTTVAVSRQSSSNSAAVIIGETAGDRAVAAVTDRPLPAPALTEVPSVPTVQFDAVPTIAVPVMPDSAPVDLPADSVHKGHVTNSVSKPDSSDGGWRGIIRRAIGGLRRIGHRFGPPRLKPRRF